MKYAFDWKEYASLARKMVSEGCVLLKNDDKVLPLCTGAKVAVFGRIQFDYIKSGTGSGGMVNAPYTVSILDALKEEKDIILNEHLIAVYEEWLKDHPFDVGVGWATEPWSQVEMEVSDELAAGIAEESDIALVIIGRTAGEDRDNTPDSYNLGEVEEKMIATVTKHFSKVAVILNVGNIIDMKWVDKYNPQAVMYVWQGGSEGGHGVVDVLTGSETPSGRLSDTIAYNIEDYPSSANFGDKERNFYVEDIYVGYRYFESVAKDKVMYPFGFGLSYTTFDLESSFSIVDDKTMRIDTIVKNTGKRLGKEVVQFYFEPAQGKLGKPLRNLIRFGKTQTLLPGASETVTATFTIDELASFDDSGVTGHKDAWVLEAGEYILYAGTDVRNADIVGSFTLSETIVTKQLTEACTPVLDYKRMKLNVKNDGTVTMEREAVPTRTYDLMERIEANRPMSEECTGNQGYKFVDYIKGDVSVEDYLAQLTDEELICMTRGEGMCSPKVTPGIAGAIGGVTKSLHETYGMPIAGCSDGPSGIRLDCGAPAFSLPSGTLQACSYNTELIEQLYEYEGMELRKNKIDTLLGPGINIHRNPMNGRNFEYYSEDPYLTGACAVAELNGLHKYNVTGTCKHFATNNQEAYRHFVDAVVSQRALREIYLKAYRMAVVDGGAYSIMTTYGPLNGIYTATNYDLVTTILRGEWGFKGLVMTDWWAKTSYDDDTTPDVRNTTNMIRSQNDVYMVTADSAANANDDNSAQGIATGKITRGELLRAARNICRFLKKSPVAIRMIEGEDEIENLNPPKGADKNINFMPAISITDGTIIDIEGLKTEGGSDNQYAMHIEDFGMYDFVFKMRSLGSELSQTSMTVFENTMLRGTVTLKGGNDEWVERTVSIDATYQADNYFNIYFSQSGLEIAEIRAVLVDRRTMAEKRDSNEL